MREMPYSKMLWLLGAQLLCLFLGCHHAQLRKSPEPEATPGVVDVGGDVRNPQAIPFAKGLTLRQAISRAGGIATTEQAAANSLISVHRGHGLKASVYYFPPQYVISGIAGECLLREGDLVQVGSIEHSGLHAEQVGDGEKFFAEGMIKHPGSFSTSSTLFVFSHLTQGGNPLGVEGGNVVLLSRTPQDGIGMEYYLLPWETFLGPAYGSLAITAGDHFLFTRAELVPILTESLLRPAMEKSAERATQKYRTAHARHRLQQDLKRQQVPASFAPLARLRSTLP